MKRASDPRMRQRSWIHRDRRVLLIGASPALARALRDEGLSVLELDDPALLRWAETGAEDEQVGPVHLIVADLPRLGLGGLAGLAELRRVDGTLPLALLAGVTDRGAEWRARSLRADTLLQGRAGAAVLPRVVRQLLTTA